MTQDMHVYGNKKRATREMNRSSHTLPILKEYGWSMPRVCLEYGWSIAGVWLEYAKGVTCHLNHVLRLAAVLLLMIGVQNAWG
jgi:hypothetical protein